MRQICRMDIWLLLTSADEEQMTYTCNIFLTNKIENID